MGLVKNRESLTGHGMKELRSVALDVIEAGLEALDPFGAVQRTLTLQDGQLHVAGHGSYDLNQIRNIYVLGAGKASLRVAEGVEALLGDRITAGLVVVPRGQRGELSRIAIWQADHPVPSELSVEGARRLLTMAAAAGPNDLVIACVTGGSSALACAPPAGVTLAEKAQLNRMLLESGADIVEINSVRKHVSEIKGGRLASRAAPARILNLTVSDVAGDPPDYITDLTVADTSTVADAVQVLHRHGLWERVAPSIRNHLSHAERAESPDLSGIDIRTVMMVTGDTGCAAMAQRARELGYEPMVLTTFLEGESQEVGRVLASIARECFHKGRPARPPCVLLGCGGETTVTLAGEGVRYGSGGPNQEVALGMALKLGSDDPIAAAYVDTDGHDGGTQYAGALVDGLTRERARSLGLDLGSLLRVHAATEPLARLDDLVVTGLTGTNVNDIFAVVVGTPPA